MFMYTDSQDFLDGWRTAKKNNVTEEYVHVFLESYKRTGDSKYAKNNALRHATAKFDSSIVNMEVL